MTRRILFIYLILSNCISAFCNNSATSGNLLFETISAGGISLNTRIYTLQKDYFGFIWLGTDYGLVRYDGYKAQRIDWKNHPSANLLNTVGIESLSLTKDSTLWVGSQQGLFRLNLNNYDLEYTPQFRKSNIRALLFENDSCLWVGTDEGLFRYNPQNNTRTHYNTLNSGLSQNVVRCLYTDKSGNLWVGTENKLNLLQAGASTFLFFDLKQNYKPEIKNNLILDISPGINNNDSILFIGTETGLYVFDRINYKYIAINQQNCALSNEVIKTIYPAKNNLVLLGTDFGLFRLNINSMEIDSYFHNPFNQYSIINNEIWMIYPDIDRSLWLATSNGLSKVSFFETPLEYTPVVFQQNNEPIGTRVADVSVDTLGNYWIGTGIGLFKGSTVLSNKGLYRTSWSSELNIENVNSIYIDAYNRKWIGSVAGINIWDPTTKKMYLPAIEGGPSSRVSSSYISSIIKGPNHTVWIGTWGGGLYNAKAVKKTDDIKISYIADLNGQIVMGHNNIWALNENALSKFSFSTEKVEEINIPTSIIPDAIISSICYGRNGEVWLGTKNNLITYHVEKDSFEVVQMPVQDELIVIGLIEDKHGDIWGASNNTLFKYSTHKKRFHYLPVTNNLPLKKFILSPFRSIQDSMIIACGYDGYISFNPSSFFKESVTAPVYITSVKANGIPILPNQKINGKTIIHTIVTNLPEIELKYESRNLSLEFSSFRYRDIKQEQYAVQLLGYEDKWRVLEAGSNAIDYINLPPDNYIFNVKLYPDDDQGIITSLPIRIRMPLWASTPLLVFYFLVLLSLILFLISQYHRNIKYKAKVSLIQLEKETNEMLTSSKIKFYINISHELLNSISLIIDPVKQLIAKTDLKDPIHNTLKIIDRNAHFLKVYIDQLLNFRKIETGHSVDGDYNSIELVSFCQDIMEFYKNKAISKEINLRLHARFKSISINTDEEKLFSIIQNLLSNAIKYTPKGGEITISLKHQKDKKIVVEVQDTGIGIDKPEHQKIFERFYQVQGKDNSRGAGIGLTIAKDFAEILGGEIELESMPGEGALFRVILPANYTLTREKNQEIFVKEYVSSKEIESAKVFRQSGITSNPDLPTVLIVDQNEDIFLYIGSALKNKFHFIWANSGNEALDLIKNRNMDIIISEIQLPDIDGINFCKKVRKNQKTSRIPFVFLTMKTEMENQLQAIDAGVDIFITKPFEIEVLEANITNLLGRTLRTKEFINRQLLMNAKEVEIDSRDDKLLKEVVDYIHTNITKTHISTQEISYSIGVSHSSLYRKIKKITGMSLNEFIRHIRLQKAEKMLRKGQYSVSEVIYQVGFTNHSYFAKCFKKQFGKNPKEYTRLT